MKEMTLRNAYWLILLLCVGSLINTCALDRQGDRLDALEQHQCPTGCQCQPGVQPGDRVLNEGPRRSVR